jgi:[acyl-carrier-protein] S-malonyltransferase
MAEEVKETRYATAAEAEVSQVAAGQAPKPPAHEDAPRRELSTMPVAADVASRLPGLRDLPGPGSDRAAGAGARLNSPLNTVPFLHFNEVVHHDRVFVFPGQGAQSVGMGRDLYEGYPAARQLFDRADDILEFKLSRVIFEGPEDELQQTKNAQPAIAVTSLALLRVATELNPHLLERPAWVAGHSLGEYPALVAAGAMAFDDAIRLLRTRGRLMQEAGQVNPGTMAAILGLDVAECDEVCRESGAEICTVNAPGQVVIGGRRDAVARALDYAKARGAAKVIPLSVSGAFHSSLMRPAGDGMVQPIATTTIVDPLIPVVGNCTASPLTDATAIRNELIDQVCRPVQWSGTVEWLESQGATTYVEFGPGRVLTAIIKRMQRKSVCINVSDAESLTVDL